MTEPDVSLCLADAADGTTLPAQAPVELGKSGRVLHVLLPAGRFLSEARLHLAAPALAAPQQLLNVTLTCDLGDFPAGGSTVAWLQAALPEERAITGIRVLGKEKSAVRLRFLSRGAWRPLTPPDMIAVAASEEPNAGTETPNTGRILASPVPLTPVAASAIMAEMQAPFSPAKDAPEIFLPAPRLVNGLSIFGTDQPCHVTVSIGTDAPFFLREGPLPTEPIEVEGLLRAAQRFLTERPGTTIVPLRIAAAGDGKLIIAGFEFALAPVPATGTGSGRGTSAGTSPAQDAGLTLFPKVSAPAKDAAQLCDGTHVVAQRLTLSAAGEAVARLDLFLRAGTEPPKGFLTLHRDDPGNKVRPAAEPLPGIAPVPLGAVPANAPGWVQCPLPAPCRLEGPVWVVCRVSEGEAQWFTAASPPDGVNEVLTSGGGADWQPAAAPADTKIWAQLSLGLLPATTG